MIRGLECKRITQVAISAALLSGAVACGGSQSYAVPDTVCGKKVDAKLLGELLPSGESLKANSKNLGANESVCELSVDGTPTLHIDEIKQQAAVNAAAFAKSHPGRFANPEKARFGDDSVSADSAVLSVNSCPHQGKKSFYILDISLENTKPAQNAPLRTKLARFAASYLPVGAEAMGCGS
ncbi:hypothetical protein AB0I49_15720 [Streptomyces sp. NPDC050617]|uniref:hypothetical protein n=1 Tax=Streptomyces sp. NPDC050617 TaxID=3154628 RepID=UPI003426CE68